MLRCSLAASIILACTSGSTFAGEAASSPAKLRLIVETDAGGDPDDEQSLVRFLLYACDFEVEGIICTRPETKRDENNNPAKTGLDIVRRHLDAYDAVYDKLQRHAEFPAPKTLRGRTVAGYDDVDDGVRLIIAAVDRDDDRPVWFSNWGTNDGTTSSLARALDRVRKERGEKGYAAFKRKLRLCSDDKFGDHTEKLAPAWPLWVYTKFPEMDGGRWYHRFGPLTATAGGFDLERDVLQNHGPLGALYPTNTHLEQKEGDTPEFLYLVPNGLNEPDEPAWGSWAGRFGKQKEAGARQYFEPNVRDTQAGKTHRDFTLSKWAAHLQNDFRARMDWCVRDRADANHPPRVKLAGELRRQVRSGDVLELDASASHDPDDDELTVAWFYYPEAGTHRGAAPKIAGEGMQAKVVVPGVERDATIHIIAIVTDRGEPPLTRYARIVLTGQP